MTLDDLPRCPTCNGPSIGHAEHTRGTHLRCMGCGVAWYASREAHQLAEAFAAAWEARQRVGFEAGGAA